jgi:3-methyladenine DNA glycosylase Tag
MPKIENLVPKTTSAPFSASSTSSSLEDQVSKLAEDILSEDTFEPNENTPLNTPPRSLKPKRLDIKEPIQEERKYSPCKLSPSFKACFASDKLCKGPLIKEKVYVISNESLRSSPTSRTSLEKIADQTLTGDTIFGTSGFYTLSLASLKRTPGNGFDKIKNILIADISENTRAFWKDMSRIIRGCPEREKAINLIIQRLETKKDTYFPRSPRSAEMYSQDIMQSIQSGESWLSTDDRYQRIYEIFLSEGFQFVSCNLFDESDVAKIMQNIEQAEATIDSTYFSNIHEYAILDGKMSSFRRAIDPLIGAKTLVTRTAARCIGCFNKYQLQQHVVRKNSSAAAIEHLFPDPRVCALHNRFAHFSQSP